MVDESIGYYEDPQNGNGIIRARTTKHIRSWHFPREMRSLEAFNEELGRVEFPGIYILFDHKSNKAYIGEAKSLYNRLKNHFANPEDKIKNWDSVIVINDGRPATQSDFNDNVVRLALEDYLIHLFKTNRYAIVSQGEPQKPNPLQKVIVGSLIEEINFFLSKKGLITKLIEKKGQEEVLPDELKKIILKSGFKIQKWGAYEAEIDNHKVFIRPGSPKPKGWQVTFRDVFKDALQKGEGYLLMPRDGVLMIPFKEIQKAIDDKNAYKRNTIDIFISFGDNAILLVYKKNSIDVIKFRLVK